MHNFRCFAGICGAVLLVASLLAGCGTTDPKNPTATTNGMVTAMLAVTDAIIGNATGSPVNTPFATQAAPSAAEQSDPADALRLLTAVVSNLSQPQAALASRSFCYGGGWVDLSAGSATITDARDAFGHGTVTLTVPSQTAIVSNCHAHGMTVNGSLTLTMDDSVQIDPVDSNNDRWTVKRVESAHGGLTAARDLNNGSYSTGTNGLDWTRSGPVGSAYTIRANYNKPLQDIVGTIEVNQTLTVRANGQTCSGHMQAVTLFGNYTWNCSGQ